MEKLMKILSELRLDIDFANEKELITGGVLDSFDVVALVEEINEGFNVEITPEHLTPENFDSAEAIFNLITALQGIKND
jgi:acyl carrier protein